MKLGEEVNSIAKEFPKDELYNSSFQIRRAVHSSALNIAEGSLAHSDPEHTKFISYALRSLAEVVTCFYKAKRRRYITDDNYMKHYSDSFNLMNMVVAFQKT